MSKEAMKLALEALVLNNDEWKSLDYSGDSGYWKAEDQDHYQQTNKAITALREALAEQPAQQEPFGYFRYDLRLDAWVQNREGKPGTAFYTSPPTQRTWIGLTDEEIDLFINGKGDEDDEDYVEPTGDGFGLTDADLVQLVRKSEAKLKEKNT